MNTIKFLFIFIFLGIVTFPAYKALRHPYMISGHDAEAALVKSVELSSALNDGQFPVRWSKKLNFGLGQPTFTFTYNLPYYLTDLISRTGLSHQTALKIILAGSFPIGAFGVYLWLKKYFGDSVAVASGLLYSFFPYQFANVYVRFAIGEVVAGVIIPYTLWVLGKLVERPTRRRFVLLSFLCAMTLLSHNFYGLLMMVLWPTYIFTKRKNYKIAIISLLLGSALTTYFVIPAAVYKELTFLKDLPEWFLNSNNYVNIVDLVRPSWGFGGVNTAGELSGLMSVQVGIMHVVLFLLSIIFISKKRSTDSLFWLLVTVLGLFLMTKYSSFVWERVELLRNLQFPWRMLFVVRLGIVFCCGVALSNIVRSNAFRAITVVGLTVTTLWILNKDYWRVGKYYAYKDKTIESIGYPGTLTMLLEETPIWHSFIQEANPYNFIQVAQGKAEFENLVWKSNYHKIVIDAKEATVVNSKVHFWPGWNIEIDGKRAGFVDPWSDLSYGLLTYQVPEGKHIVELYLREPLVNKVANGISLLTLAALLLIAYLPYRYLSVFKNAFTTQIFGTKIWPIASNIW